MTETVEDFMAKLKTRPPRIVLNGHGKQAKKRGRPDPRLHDVELEKLERENGKLKAELETIKSEQAELQDVLCQMIDKVKEQREELEQLRKQQPAPASNEVVDALLARIAELGQEVMAADTRAAIAEAELKEANEFKVQISAPSEATEMVNEVMAVVHANEPLFEWTGYSAAHVVGQLFSWLAALSDPSRNVAAIQNLALNFGIELPAPRLAPMPQPAAMVPPTPPAASYPAPQTYTGQPQTAAAPVQPAADIGLPASAAPLTLDAVQAMIAATIKPLMKENRRLEVAAARKAGSSMRINAPDAVAAASQSRREQAWQPQKNDSPRDSIMKALAQLRG